MLPKQFRLKNTSAFNATYKHHHIISDDNVCVYIGKEKTDLSLNTKIAFVVSKKIHKRAVVRNRIKRLMRENIRLAIKNNELNNINKYMSLIFVAKPSSIYASYNTLKTSIYQLCNNI